MCVPYVHTPKAFSFFLLHSDSQNCYKKYFSKMKQGKLKNTSTYDRTRSWPQKWLSPPPSMPLLLTWVSLQLKRKININCFNIWTALIKFALCIRDDWKLCTWLCSRKELHFIISMPLQRKLNLNKAVLAPKRQCINFQGRKQWTKVVSKQNNQVSCTLNNTRRVIATEWT